MSEQKNGKFYRNVAELTRLAATQIRVAVTEADQSVEQLSKAFTNIVQQDKLIRQSIQKLPDAPEIDKIKTQISQLAAEIGVNVQNAVVAFQFYDRLCQRLDHTSECLRNLSAIENHQLQSSINEVLLLKDEVYNHFTMKEERQLFDAVLANNDFEQAITEYTVARAKTVAEEATVNGIELF